MSAADLRYLITHFVENQVPPGDNVNKMRAVRCAPQRAGALSATAVPASARQTLSPRRRAARRAPHLARPCRGRSPMTRWRSPWWRWAR